MGGLDSVLEIRENWGRFEEGGREARKRFKRRAIKGIAMKRRAIKTMAMMGVEWNMSVKYVYHSWVYSSTGYPSHQC